MNYNLATEIWTYLSEHESKQTVISLQKHFHNYHPQEINSALSKLSADRRIVILAKQEILVIQKDIFLGTIVVTKKGYGFIKDDTTEYFVHLTDLNTAMNNDLVVCQKKKQAVDDKKTEAVVLKVVERNNLVLVGKTVLNKKRQLIFFPQDVNLQKQKINILNPMKGLVNHYYQAKIVRFKKYCLDVCLQKDLGDINAPGNDILAIAYEKNLPVKFNSASIKQAESFANEISVDELKNRRDLTKDLLVTIDGDDSKDFDDAVVVTKLPNNNFLLKVAIADVSHFVPAHSPLDLTAQERGCSAYLINQVIPMLPKRLSNNLCSLNPHQRRLVMVCEMEINNAAQVVRHDIYQAVMRSAARLTYRQVNEFLIKKTSNKIPEFIQPMLNTAAQLYKILNCDWHKRGVITFAVDEPSFILDNNGAVVDIQLRSTGDAEHLIECFMVLANETVAKTINEMKLPFIYRIHPEPQPNKLAELNPQLHNLQINCAITNDDLTVKTLQTILEQVTDESLIPIVSSLLLRSMEKARYSTDNIGHFGLASSCYTHFTSPIRRYPDLLVHRLLRGYLINKQDFVMNVTEIANLAEQTNQRETAVVECEREVIQMKKTEYMSQFAKQTFVGRVASVTKFGLFVQLPNTVEGLIRKEALGDDEFIYDEEQKFLYGKKTKQVWKMGQSINVQVKKTDLLSRQIDFELAK